MIMKLPVYLRQSWQIMLKDRQYSLIYVVGVALSMAFVMAFLMPYAGSLQCYSG